MGIDDQGRCVWQPLASSVAYSDRGNKIDEEVHQGRSRNGSSIVKNVGQETSGRRTLRLACGVLKITGHIGSCPGYALLTSHGKATKPRKDEFRERVGMIIERTLAGEARMETCKDRIAETEQVRERRRARIERGAVDVPEEPGDKDDEQVAVRYADASGGYIIENQHEEKT